MKITRYRTDGNPTAVTVISLEKALPLFMSEIQSAPVSQLRYSIKRSFAGIRCRIADTLPVYVFSGVFDRKPPHTLLHYNGVVLLEVNRLVNREEVLRIKSRVAALPQTFAAFVGAGGKSVKVLVRFSLPDGTLPQLPDQIELFHTEAYRLAAMWYSPQLDREIELKEPLPERGCRLSYDPALYYNPDAAVIRMEQPVRVNREGRLELKRDKVTDPIDRLLPGNERSRIISLLFGESYRNAYNKARELDGATDLHSFFTLVAQNCLLSGIPEEDGVKWTKIGQYSDEKMIRNCFRTVYIRKDQLGKKPVLPPVMSLMATLEDFMQRRYRFRKNTIKGVVEYQEVVSFYFTFQPVDKAVMNSICMDAHNEGIPVWDKDICRYVESNRIERYDPIEDFMDQLPHWDGKDYIREMAERIPCNHPRWVSFFRIWFLSMVAHWLQRDTEHGNSALPLLVGDQGCGKSTFCMNLLPPHLREYYTDSIDFSKRRETELALGRFLLINLDEFDSISRSYQGFLKHVVQKAAVQTRLPYGTVVQKLRRYATFIATSNNFDLLTDPTGSRRFICVEVTGKIDNAQPVVYEQLYAQALTLLSREERYWFTAEEERYITAFNHAFKQSLPEEEWVHAWFRTPETGERFEELTCGEILRRISDKEPQRKFRQNMVSALGRELKNAFESRRTNRGWVYRVVQKE